MEKATIVLSWTKGKPRVEYCGTQLEEGLKKFEEIANDPGEVHRLEIIKDGRRKKNRTLNGKNGFSVIHSTASKDEQKKSAEANAEHVAKLEAEKAAKAKKKAKKGKDEPNTESDGDEDGPKISKSAAKLAEEHNIDLSKVEGTGKEGAITKPDIEKLIG